MKRTILIAALVLFAGLSAAEVGYDGPEDQPHIMAGGGSGGSSQAGTSVGPNGTEDSWEADFRQLNATCISENQSEEIEDISYSEEGETEQVTWTGYIQTSDPCHEADLTEVISEGDNVYRLNITTKGQDGMCMQCLGVVKYEAEFSTEDPFEIEILHDGEQVETVTHPDYGEDSSTEPVDSEPSSGPLQSLIQWLRNLF